MYIETPAVFFQRRGQKTRWTDKDLECIKKEAIEKRREVPPDDELTREFAKRILALLSFLFFLDHGFQCGDYLGLARLIQVSIIYVYVCVCRRERERVRERERERERDRERQRETEREKERDRKTDAKREREMKRERERKRQI